MAFHIDAEKIVLDDLRKRIEATDLVPSRACLKESIKEKVEALERQDITTLAALRYALKNTKRLAELAEATDIEPQYLILLRREIESYFPKPAPLKDFDWMPGDEIMKLEQNGVRNAAILHERTSHTEKQSELMNSTGVDAATLEILAQLADLTRVQWVSPTVARMLIEAGYHSPAEVAAADANELYEALASVNADGRFFKGTIGLRDIKRLIQAASYIR